MEFQKEILEFVTEQLGGCSIVREEDQRIVYADELTRRLIVDEKLPWSEDNPTLNLGERAYEWEYLDICNKKYYRLQQSLFQRDEKIYRITQVSDITEYMGLNHDITKYMSFFKKLSKFQSAVLERLSETYYTLLPMVVDYFKAPRIYFLLERNHKLEIISYDKSKAIYENDRIELDNAVEQVFSYQQELREYETLPKEIQKVISSSDGPTEGSYICLCQGVASDQHYAILMEVNSKTDMASVSEEMLMNVIRLYVENGILREKIIYESEHDQLTGLYNKGKYLAMMESTYQNMDSIGIFNMDVNYLKQMNDTYGHEAGDKLLIKAADSIRKVTTDMVHGYRMGGDEYLMIACNCKESDVADIKARWEQALEELNRKDDGINCIIAIGTVYGSKGYDFAALMKQADELMYQDKVAKKKPGEEIR